MIRKCCQWYHKPSSLPKCPPLEVCWWPGVHEALLGSDRALDSGGWGGWGSSASPGTRSGASVAYRCPGTRGMTTAPSPAAGAPVQQIASFSAAHHSFSAVYHKLQCGTSASVQYITSFSAAHRKLQCSTSQASVQHITSFSAAHHKLQCSTSQASALHIKSGIDIYLQ